MPFEEELLGTCVMMKITETYRWHIEGEILERGLSPVEIDEGYFDKQKEMVEQKKNNYIKKPKKISDKNKEKLLELVDLEEESEDDNDETDQSKSSKSEISESSHETPCSQSEVITEEESILKKEKETNKSDLKVSSL